MNSFEIWQGSRWLFNRHGGFHLQSRGFDISRDLVIRVNRGRGRQEVVLQTLLQRAIFDATFW